MWIQFHIEKSIGIGINKKIFEHSLGGTNVETNNWTYKRVTNKVVQQIRFVWQWKY
jgi:hypothetical protein